MFYYNRDGLFSIDVIKGIHDREASYDDAKERYELEKNSKNDIWIVFNKKQGSK